jgi:hypothetical protein
LQESYEIIVGKFEDLNLSRWYKYVPRGFTPSLSEGNLVYCRQHVTALWSIRLLSYSKQNSTLTHLLAMQRNFTFVAGITDSSPDTISRDECACGVLLAWVLKILCYTP